MDEQLEMELNSKQCAEVALYMWNKYVEETGKPQFTVLSFNEWLDLIVKNYKEQL